MASSRSPPIASHSGSDHSDRSPLPRPMWQRILLPLLGLLCLVLATLGGFLPFLPGWPLALIGLPLLASFNPRWEAWIRRRRRRLLRIATIWCRRRWHRVKRGLASGPAGRRRCSTRLPRSRHHQEPS